MEHVVHVLVDTGVGAWESACHAQLVGTTVSHRHGVLFSLWPSTYLVISWQLTNTHFVLHRPLQQRVLKDSRIDKTEVHDVVLVSARAGLAAWCQL